MKNYFTLILLIITLCVQAQYTTPGNGETFTLNDLTLTEPTVVVLSGTNEYTINGNLTISANDILLINESTTVKIAPNILLTVFGNFETSVENPATESILITAVDTSQPYEGFRLEEGSQSNFAHTTFEYGGGFKVLSANFVMDNCVVQYMNEGAATGAAISFSRGRPMISQSHFYMNDLPAIASGANQSVAAKIEDNIFEKNGQANENRPQINLSSSGVQDSIIIARNTIIGDPTKEMVGGIAIANFFGIDNYVQIIENTIYDNRYGIAIYGSNHYALVKDNIIRNNNTQNNPMQGGSGINLYSTGDEINTNNIITGNTITGNLWGITLQGNAFANIGDGTADSPGLNTFENNGNNGVTYALYNNTANNISAQYNCWNALYSTDEAIENVIFHQVDDSSLGLVDFSNYTCELSVDDISLNHTIEIYPNPATDFIYIKSDFDGNAEIYHPSGKLVLKMPINAGLNKVNLNIEKGIYFLKIFSTNEVYTKKLLIK